MKLVLFDVDGTLLWSDGAGRRAMEAALTATFGDRGATDYRFDGKTDPQIVRDLMRRAGHSDAAIDARMEALTARYLARLASELASGARAVRLLDGVPELLDALERRDDVVLGLLTGNLRDGALAKLRAAGLDPERFRVGAFGSDHHDRPALPAVAQRRAREELGLDIPASAIVVVGDTPADIACAHAVGARAVAVATGRYSEEELGAHAPHAVVATLADTAHVVGVILGA